MTSCRSSGKKKVENSLTTRLFLVVPRLLS